MNRNIAYVAALLCCVFSADASAQVSRDRAGTWEVGAQIFNLGSESLRGDEGSTLDVDSEFGWGFTGAYNFTNRFAVGLDFGWSRPDYEATRVLEGSLTPDTIRASMDITNFQLKGTFYLLEGDITPYVEAGIGWTRVDSNIADGPPTTGCWWDPWWGYICAPFFSTYADTRTSYSGALGLRWDMTQEWTVRASFGLLELDTSSRTQDAQLDTYRVDFAWRF